jgi:Flp pilus assembly protein TadD
MRVGPAIEHAAWLLAAASLLHPAACLAQTRDLQTAAPQASVPQAPAPQAPAQQPAAHQTALQTAPPEPAGENDAPLPIPPVPPRIAEGAEYEICLDMLATDPSGADAMAGNMGTGEGAQHCHALAEVELGNTETGAALLDRLAAGSSAPASARAVVFGQAEQAWAMAGRSKEAYASASRAMELSPDDPEVRIGHAIAAMSLGRFAEAADDLTHALDLDAKRVDALILRATALRTLGRLADAEAAITEACALDPQDPDGLLERGIIRQRLGDLAGARADWEHVADLAPDTPTGDLAQQNLALLEAGPRQ